jgi:hypothetical protein
MAERIRERHRDAEVIPYAWHYLTHEASDGVVVGSNRSLDAKPGSYGHMRGDATFTAKQSKQLRPLNCDLKAEVNNSSLRDERINFSASLRRTFRAARQRHPREQLGVHNGWNGHLLAAYSFQPRTKVLTSALQ